MVIVFEVYELVDLIWSIALTWTGRRTFLYEQSLENGIYLKIIYYFSGYKQLCYLLYLAINQ